MNEEKVEAAEPEADYYNIHAYPSPVLRIKTKPVEIFDKELQEKIDKMIETMYRAKGVGLAATQVALNDRIFVYDIDQPSEKRNPRVLINAQIVERGGEVISENEGCLSVINYRADIKRYKSVVVEGVGRGGLPTRIEADGKLAITFQHEIDHLDGVLFIDYISRLKRNMYTKRINKALKRYYRGQEDGH